MLFDFRAEFRSTVAYALIQQRAKKRERDVLIERLNKSRSAQAEQQRKIENEQRESVRDACKSMRGFEFTSREISEVCGLTKKMTLRRLRELQADGLLTPPRKTSAGYFFRNAS